MKYILGLLLVLTVSFTSFGAYQYDVNWNGVQINQNMSLTVQFTSNQFFKNYDTFGYYVLKYDNTYRYQMFDIKEANGKKFDLGDFIAGENIGFFVGKGDNYTTHFGLFDKNGNNHYGLEVWTPDWSVYDQFDIKLYGGEPIKTPSGQPLPGVLASLAIGAGALGTRRYFKKKTV